MKTIDLASLCAAIKGVVPKAPVTFLTDDSVLFLGSRLSISGNTARTWRFEFKFDNADSFVSSLRTFGLMLNHSEIEKILRDYENIVNKTKNR